MDFDDPIERRKWLARLVARPSGTRFRPIHPQILGIPMPRF
jgi:hypothetical protein